MGVALRGNLRDFGIADVFQLIGQQRKTGVLEIATRRETVRLHFDDGAIVCAWPAGEHEHAAVADLLGRCGVVAREALEAVEAERRRTLQPLPALLLERERVTPETLTEIVELCTQETLFTLLRRKKGSFDFRAGPPVDPGVPVTRFAAEQILMDGLRMVDEWRTFAAQVPSDAMVFRRTLDFEAYREQARGAAADRCDLAERVHRLVDGRLTARRVIDLSRMGTFTGVRLLADLRLAGAIEPVDAAASPRTRRVPRAPARRGLPRPLAAVLPLLLAAAVAWLALRPAAPSGVAVWTDPLDAARSGFATLRVRNALEAWRVVTGQWPSSLDVLRRRGLLASDALVARDGRPYYYRRHEDAAVLLAPEH